MHEGEHNWNVPEKRENTDRRLHHQHASQRDRAGTAMGVVRAIEGMKCRKSKEQVGNHAVYELHGKMIIEHEWAIWVTSVRMRR